MTTPIASAKRPKKSDSVDPYFSKTTNSTPSVVDECLHARETITPILTLSPIHNARPVTRDFHQFHTSALTSPKQEKNVPDSGSNQCTSNIDSASKDEGDSHGAVSWVGRKVDAIFSPVLSFLHGAANGPAEDSSAALHAKSLQLKSNKSDQKSSAAESSRSVSTMVHISFGQARHDHSIDENTSSCSSTLSTDNTTDQCTNFDCVLNIGPSRNGDVSMENSQGYPCEYDRGKIQTTAANGNMDQGEDDDDEEEEFNPYLFIKCLPPYKFIIPPGWTSRPKALPPVDSALSPPIPPICLVLDLDETLVHCTVEPVVDADMIFPVDFNGTEYKVYVRCRPFLHEFLEAVSCKFEVVIFTASQQVYADKLLDKIDPDGKFIRHRMFRDSCLPVEGNFLKDLTVLGRDLSKAVLVDNSPHAFGYQVDNGIPIESWFDDPNDKELPKLERFLQSLHGADDVRDIVRETFQTHQLVSDA